jgi:hypothetical protein
MVFSCKGGDYAREACLYRSINIPYLSLPAKVDAKLFGLLELRRNTFEHRPSAEWNLLCPGFFSVCQWAVCRKEDSARGFAMIPKPSGLLRFGGRSLASDS